MATMIIGENGVVKDIVLYKKGRKPYRPTLRLVFTEDGELVSSSARMHSSKLEKLTATYGELIVCTTDKRPAYKIGKAAKKTSLSTEELERLIKQLKKKIEDLNEIAKSIKEKPSLTELYTQIDVIFYRVYTLYELLGFDNTLYKQMRVYWITALSKQRNLIQGQAGSKKEKNTAGGEMDKRNNISRIIIAMKDLEDLLGIIEDDGAADQEGLVEQEPALRSSILRLRADVKEAGDEELRRRLEKIETLFRRLFNIDFEAEEDLKVEQKIYNAINMAA
jgi:hypothetical protein